MGLRDRQLPSQRYPGTRRDAAGQFDRGRHGLRRQGRPFRRQRRRSPRVRVQLDQRRLGRVGKRCGHGNPRHSAVRLYELHPGYCRYRSRLERRPVRLEPLGYTSPGVRVQLEHEHLFNHRAGRSRTGRHRRSAGPALRADSAGAGQQPGSLCRRRREQPDNGVHAGARRTHVLRQRHANLPAVLGVHLGVRSAEPGRARQRGHCH